MLTQHQENLLKGLELDQKNEMVTSWITLYKDTLKVSAGNKRQEYLQKIDNLNLYLYKLENPKDSKNYITQRKVGGLAEGFIYVCDKQLQRIINNITELSKEKSELQKQVGLYYTKKNKKNKGNIIEVEVRLESVNEAIAELTRQQQEMEYHLEMQKAI